MRIKTSIIGLVLFFIASSLYSQEESNKYLIGGSVGFMYTKTKGDNSLNASLNANKTVSMSGSPLIGFFVCKKIAIGLSLEYSFSNTDYEDGPVTYMDLKNYLAAPFLRYYFPKNFFGQIQFNYGLSKQEGEMIYTEPFTNTQMKMPYKSKYTTMGIGVGLGYCLKIKENVYIEPMLRYVTNYLNDRNTDKNLNQNSFFINIGMVVNI